MTSSEARSSETSSSEAVFHQKFKFIKLCKLEDSKVVQWIGCRIYIVKERKRVTTANSKGFKSIGCLFLFEALTKYKVQTVQPLSPLPRVYLCYKTRITALPATVFLHTWNGFEIAHS